MMQYILSEEEYTNLVNKNELLRKRDSEKLLEFCRYVSNNLPVKEGWYKGKIWKCILDTDEEWYCDDCPSSNLCPYPRKKWSE